MSMAKHFAYKPQEKPHFCGTFNKLTAISYFEWRILLGKLFLKAHFCNVAHAISTHFNGILPNRYEGEREQGQKKSINYENGYNEIGTHGGNMQSFDETLEIWNSYLHE